VAIRHVGVDAAILAEVFYQRYYHPPAEVSRAIGEPRAILDLGANIGLFGAFAIRRWPEAQIVAYEPDPENAAVHGQTVAVNGLAGRWTLERAATGTRNGQARFAAGLGAGSHVVDGQTDAAGTEVTVPLHDVLPRMANAELVKMDIEGGEWPILHDPRFVHDPPSALVLEYHPRSCPGIDPHAVASDALARAGLRTAPIWRRDDGHGMVWAWR
jgi:FkbM family methyltransferase